MPLAALSHLSQWCCAFLPLIPRPGAPSCLSLRHSASISCFDPEAPAIKEFICHHSDGDGLRWKQQGRRGSINTHCIRIPACLVSPCSSTPGAIGAAGRGVAHPANAGGMESPRRLVPALRDFCIPAANRARIPSGCSSSLPPPCRIPAPGRVILLSPAARQEASFTLGKLRPGCTKCHSPSTQKHR